MTGACASMGASGHAASSSAPWNVVHGSVYRTWQGRPQAATTASQSDLDSGRATRIEGVHSSSMAWSSSCRY